MFTHTALLGLLLATLLVGAPGRAAAAGAADCETFPQTGQQVCGAFLAYWRANGGLAQQGYPLSAPFNELSTIDGRYYLVQYFERAVFELHPELTAPNTVLLSQLGRDTLLSRYPQGLPATPPPAALAPLPGADDCEEFAATGQRACGPFRAYWHANGGLAQQGYPLTPVFVEKSAIDGQIYLVQYFERAVFEYHSELPGGPQVLLGQLGRLRLTARYPNGPSAIDNAYVAVGQIALKANGTLVEWTIPVTNVSQRPIIAVTITVVFYDASGQLIDTSLAAAVNVEPGETRTLKGISIKGLGYARYRVLPPDLTVPGGP